MTFESARECQRVPESAKGVSRALSIDSVVGDLVWLISPEASAAPALTPMIAHGGAWARRGVHSRGQEWGELVTDSRGCPLLLDRGTLHGLGLDGLLDGLGLGLWWHGGSLPDAAPSDPPRPGLHAGCTPIRAVPRWRGRDAGLFKSGRASGVPAAPIPAPGGHPPPQPPAPPHVPS
jgi:hypothetical protein